MCHTARPGIEAGEGGGGWGERAVGVVCVCGGGGGLERPTRRPRREIVPQSLSLSKA
jgi:hypothetical protein